MHPGTAQHWVSACQQVLHAVFFFGRLNQRQIRPSEFLLFQPFQNLQENYPRSFQEYNTHLPTMTPYSILLQFVSTAGLLFFTFQVTMSCTDQLVLTKSGKQNYF